MPVQKKITLIFPSNTDGRLTHRIRNFAEDLWREIEKSGLGDVGGLETVDQAVDILTIQIKHARKTGYVRKRVRNLLKSHLLADSAETQYS
ncbi:MAG TPA: hypothetical protein VKN63_04185 [Afifellaceae bacterium]|nr:hypothetical protein [Afifellaceae bacterium]